MLHYTEDGCTNSMCLVPWATKCCPVAPNISGIITTVSFLTKMCITSHRQPQNCGSTVQKRPHKPYGILNLEVAPRHHILLITLQCNTVNDITDGP